MMPYTSEWNSHVQQCNIYVQVLSSPLVEEKEEIPNSASKVGVERGKSKEKEAQPKVTSCLVLGTYYIPDDKIRIIRVR